MLKFIAGAFMAMGAFFHGMFGGHATSTPMQARSGMASTSIRAMGHWQATSSTTPLVMGKVTAVTSTGLTVEGKNPRTGSATTTYAVDASNARILKRGDSSAKDTSALKVGDTVVVQGQISGTSVAAIQVLDSGTIPMRPANGTNPQPR